MRKEVTINYYGILLVVEGNYEKEEKQILYDCNLQGYKGYPAEFTIEKVLTESGDDIFGIFMDFQLEDLENKCLENLEE